MLLGYLEYDVTKGHKAEIESPAFRIVIVRTAYNHTTDKAKNSLNREKNVR